MLQILGMGAPLLELGARAVVWVYMPALLCLLAGFHFMRDSLYVLVLRRDLVRQARLQQARYLAFQGLLGFGAGLLLVLVIYFRKELFQCITGLF